MLVPFKRRASIVIFAAVSLWIVLFFMIDQEPTPMARPTHDDKKITIVVEEPPHVPTESNTWCGWGSADGLPKIQKHLTQQAENVKQWAKERNGTTPVILNLIQHGEWPALFLRTQNYQGVSRPSCELNIPEWNNAICKHLVNCKDNNGVLPCSNTYAFHWQDDKPDEVLQCPTGHKCILKYNLVEQFYTADAVMMLSSMFRRDGAQYHPRFDIEELLNISGRPKDQLWISILDSESNAWYPWTEDYNYVKYFNITLGLDRRVSTIHSYRSDWGIPTREYFEKNIVNATLPNKSKDIALITSNCLAQPRSSIFQQLLKLLKIDSLGACFHNTNAGLGSYFSPDGKQSKLSNIMPYKFVLTFENSNCYDYVTEKIFDALEVGAIPIYFGPPNMKEFLPSKDHKVIIDWNDFPNITAAVDYIKQVQQNPTLWNEYMTWRDHWYDTEDIPLKKMMKYVATKQRSERICDVCAMLHGDTPDIEW